MTGTVATIALLVGGCATAADDTAGGGPEPTENHTMPDGSVMEGSEHVHDDSHDHGEAGGQASGPSAAARMVCTGDVVDDVTRIMTAEATPEPSSAWTRPMFTCRFDLAQGPLVLTVHDAAQPDAGIAHFAERRAAQPDATQIRGVYSLGLPAYRAEDGLVSFLRDGKTLEVDATGLRGERFGVEGSMTRAEVAYAVASSVLACWTEHD